MTALPAVPPLEVIAARLPAIFPAGSAHRNYAIREMAARTIYVMFYAGAIEGADRWIRPSQIIEFSDMQAAKLDNVERTQWADVSLKQKKVRAAGDAWYAPNTREPVRDETLRGALIPARAVIERQNIATSSAKPRYALDAEFAALFDPALDGIALDVAIAAWQATHLSKAALARQQLVKKGLANTKGGLSVTFPDGEVCPLEDGPSSPIAKAVIEEFAPRFLRRPAALWLSQSGTKIRPRDAELAAALGLTISASTTLPDIILVDLGDDAGGQDMRFIFVEVVATDGPVHAQRKVVLTAMAVGAGFEPHHLVFLSAYLDRNSTVFRKNVPDLAWGSYVWFVAEPEHIIELRDGASMTVSRLSL